MTVVALCQCGCGAPAPIARMTNRRIGHVAGEPVRFIRGHVGNLVRRERLDESLWHEEDRGYETPCWIWNGTPNARTGYCRVKFQGRVVLAHRAMHEQEIGPIPAGYDVDHLCSQRDCVRHLEAVTRAVNVQRSRAARLTPADVHAIRESTIAEAAAARAWGVHHSTISDIRSGRTWANV